MVCLQHPGLGCSNPCLKNQIFLKQKSQGLLSLHVSGISTHHPPCHLLSIFLSFPDILSPLTFHFQFALSWQTQDESQLWKTTSRAFFSPTIRPLYFLRNMFKVFHFKWISNTWSTAAPSAKKLFRCGYKIQVLCKDRFAWDNKVKEKKP